MSSQVKSSFIITLQGHWKENYKMDLFLHMYIYNLHLSLRLFDIVSCIHTMILKFKVILEIATNFPASKPFWNSLTFSLSQFSE